MPSLLILLRHAVVLSLLWQPQKNLIKSGAYKKGLVIGAEVLSKTFRLV